MYNFNYDGSKFKLHISRERYFVNEEKRTVTVKADVSVCVPVFILKTIAQEQLPVGFSPESLYPFGLYGHDDIQMTATAKCSPEDEFDVDKGKKIALAKLEAAAYERFVYALVNWNAELQRFTESVNKMTRDFVVKGAMTSQHNWRYIDDITGVEEEASDV
jgi:hypothetical protein